MMSDLELGDIFMAKRAIEFINMQRQWRFTLMLVLMFLVIGGVFAIAYAQSGASAFNFNSPTAFPVDI